MNTPAGLAAAALVIVAAGSGARALRTTRQGRVRGRFLARTAPAVAKTRRLRAPTTIRRRIAQSGAALDPDAAWVVWAAGSVLIVGAIGVAVGAGAAVLAAVVVTAGPAVAIVMATRRRHQHVGTTLPGALDELARSLRSGASLAQAIAHAGAATPGPIGDDLTRIAAAHDTGMPLSEALLAWPSLRPVPGVRLASSALVLGLGAGGTHARAVDGVAATLREHLAVASEVRAQASQAQASALVIGLAPLAFTALACLADPRTATFLFQTTAGLACVAIGLALDAVGAVWMARVTRVER
jgi:tight adherence protein B